MSTEDILAESAGGISSDSSPSGIPESTPYEQQPVIEASDDQGGEGSTATYGQRRAERGARWGRRSSRPPSYRAG